MSGEWQAFVAMMIFFFGTVLTLTFWPVASREATGYALGVVTSIFDWIEGGLTQWIVVYAVAIAILLTMVGGVFMAIEQVYLWAKRRRDDTVNEYQIK